MKSWIVILTYLYYNLLRFAAEGKEGY